MKGRNGELTFKWVSELMEMRKGGRSEMLTIGREVGAEAQTQVEP